jgi:AraC-like DNA-binding protein
MQRIAEAASWIRAHFAQPVTVDEMATSIHMCASSFHQRFKAVTSMSPLQYQKVLRLHEARRLMLFQRMDASDADGPPSNCGVLMSRPRFSGAS